MPTSARFTTAHLLNVNERFFLIDCGEGTQIQLRKYKIGFGKINQIFISHPHGDHIFGLNGLLSTFQLLGRKADLHIFGPPTVKKVLDFYLQYFGSENNYKIVFTACGQRGMKLIYADRRVEVFSLPLKHRTETTGFLFREKAHPLNFSKEAMAKYKPGVEDFASLKEGKDLQLPDGRLIPNHKLTLPPYKRRSYAFVSDTVYDESIVDYIKTTDLLYHEATFEEKDRLLAEKTKHSTSVQAATIAKMAGVKRLLLGHFSSRYRTTDGIRDEARSIFPNSETVNDGDTYHVEREREE